MVSFFPWRSAHNEDMNRDQDLVTIVTERIGSWWSRKTQYLGPAGQENLQHWLWKNEKHLQGAILMSEIINSQFHQMETVDSICPPKLELVNITIKLRRRINSVLIHYTKLSRTGVGRAETGGNWQGMRRRG
jgi:hypothetical protein